MPSQKWKKKREESTIVNDTLRKIHKIIYLSLISSCNLEEFHKDL